MNEEYIEIVSPIAEEESAHQVETLEESEILKAN